MVELIEKFIPLRLPNEELVSMILAQIPSRLRYRNYFYQVVDPEGQWALVERTLRMVARGEDGLDGAAFLIFPEVSVPFRFKDDLVRIIQQDFRPNTVTIAGFEHISLRQFWQVLAEYDADNAEAHRLTAHGMNRAEADRPVNWCLAAVKDAEGRLHCFVEAKTHPFFGEEFLDQPRDLYRGQYLYFFRSQFAPLSFVVLICLDYIYRDEIGRFGAAGVLDHVHVAASRERPGHRDHVQDRIREQGALAWRLLGAGGYVYVCGSQPMRDAVRAAFVDVIAGHGRRSPEHAEAYLHELEMTTRYRPDLWG